MIFVSCSTEQYRVCYACTKLLSLLDCSRSISLFLKVWIPVASDMSSLYTSACIVYSLYHVSEANHAGKIIGPLLVMWAISSTLVLQNRQFLTQRGGCNNIIPKISCLAFQKIFRSPFLTMNDERLCRETESVERRKKCLVVLILVPSNCQSNALFYLRSCLVYDRIISLSQAVSWHTGRNT